MEIAIVTGGANGIGSCIVENFVKNNIYTIIVDKHEQGQEKTSETYNNMTQYVCMDIADKEQLEKLCKQIVDKQYKIVALVNNACINMGGIYSCDYDSFEYVLKVGAVAPFYLTKLLRKSFVQGASIVNISSTRQFMSQPDTESYTAAKGAIGSLTHAMSMTLAGKVRVNSISPGWIDTKGESYSAEDLKQHPAGRIGTPQDIADMVMFLCSDKASFITGQNFVVDGGMTKQMIYHNDCGWTYGEKKDEI